MSVELKQAIESMNRDFDEFKKVTIELVKQEAKGAVDPLLKAQQDKINDALTAAEDAKDAALKAQLATKRNAEVCGNKEILTEEEKKYKSAFKNFLTKGEEKMSREEREYFEIQSKALSAGNDPAGGYTVLPEFDRNIITLLTEGSPIRQYATVKIIGTDQYERLVRTEKAGAGWVSETDGRPETNTAGYRKLSIKVHEMYANPGVTQTLLDDSVVNIEQELQEQIADSFMEIENASFFHGDGVGKPRGFMKYSNGNGWEQIEQINSGAAGKVTYEGLVDLVTALKTGHLSNARFSMNRFTVGEIRKLLDGNGRPLWEPGLGAEPSSILGYPYFRAEEMPKAAAGSLSIAFADFAKAYLIIDRVGTRMLRDPYTNKPYVMFYTTRRVGGGVMNFEAIKILKLSA